MVQKVWFMTGIARGLGHALAKAVLAKGDLVIGTTRRGEQPKAWPRTISRSCRWR